MDSESAKRVVESYRDLRVYRVAFRLQQEVFELTQGFPKEERYALTDQIRRSSRSVGANIAEAWHKRSYRAHFVSKLSDADAEAAETRHWLDTAQACGYFRPAQKQELSALCRQIGKMLGKMMGEAERWCRS
ncbi:MAG: four helix bundle protein [Bacteroidota bacterium]